MLQLREITFFSMLIRLLLAVVVGGILGMERGRKNRPAGLRTYMLVCLASAIVMMTNQYVTQCMGEGDPVRMGAQVVSGIGFLGAGSIVVTQRNQIRGITTAAGLWASAAVGLAVGIGFYEVAIAGGTAVFTALTVVHKIDEISRKRSTYFELFIELKGRESMPAFVRFIRDSGLQLTNLQMENDSLSYDGSFALIATITSVDRRPRETIMDSLRHIPDLLYLEEL